jgi:hypothetical protein
MTRQTDAKLNAMKIGFGGQLTIAALVTYDGKAHLSQPQ